MIGVSALRKGHDHDPGREVAQLGHEDFPGSFVIVQVGIGQPGVASLGYAQDGCGPLRLLSPDFGAAPRSRFAGGEIENAGGVPGVGGPEQSAAARQFDIVTVSRDGQQVDRHGGKDDLDGPWR